MRILAFFTVSTFLLLSGPGLVTGFVFANDRAAVRLAQDVARDLGRLSRYWMEFQPRMRSLGLLKLPGEGTPCARCDHFESRRTQLLNDWRHATQMRKTAANSEKEILEALDEAVQEKYQRLSEAGGPWLIALSELNPIAFGEAAAQISDRFLKPEAAASVGRFKDQANRNRMMLEKLVRDFGSELANMKSGVDPDNLHMVLHFGRETQRVLSAFREIVSCSPAL